MTSARGSRMMPTPSKGRAKRNRRRVMISHTQEFQPTAIAGQLLAACAQVIRNRWELRDLDEGQMCDAGISPEALRAATDFRVWRRITLRRNQHAGAPALNQWRSAAQH
ncbi:MAG: hypothetical protein ABI831_00425 [Betaproteobacteria bacterium]